MEILFKNKNQIIIELSKYTKKGESNIELSYKYSA